MGERDVSKGFRAMLGQGSISKSVTFSQGAIVTIGFLVTGVAIAKAPIVAWVFLGALTGLLMFQLPIYAWLSSAVLAATLSRWFVATGFIPPILNFFHFFPNGSQVWRYRWT